MKTNDKTTVYDWPTRIFHWLFALLFIVAFLIGYTVDDERSLFSVHQLAGLTIGFLIVLRLIWGLVGTKYARFSLFKLRPAELIRYLKDAVVSKTKRYLGHNPASSYGALVMFICAAGLVFTGILMTGGYENELYEEIHELLAYGFLIAAVVHVAGIIFHHTKHYDSLWSSMIDGRKKKLSGATGIKNSKWAAGVLFLVLTLAWTGYLYRQYDSTARTLNLFGKELVLGEAEKAENESGEAVETQKQAGEHAEDENEENGDE